MSSSSSSPAIPTGDAAVGQHVAVDFGPEHGTCHGKVVSYFGTEEHYHVARADGEEADLSLEEYTAAVEMARSTVGSPCAPMEYTPLHQFMGRGLNGMAGKFALFPLPSPNTTRVPARGAHWRCWTPWMLRVAAWCWETTKGGIGAAPSSYARDGKSPMASMVVASEGHSGRGSRTIVPWRGRPTSTRACGSIIGCLFVQPFFLRVPRWPTMSSCAPIRTHGEGIISSTVTVMRTCAAVRRRGWMAGLHWSR
jgi:hypothetical protein